ncbi:MAG: DUF4397 domain-containing protein [Chitinophagaceae bacterium]
MRLSFSSIRSGAWIVGGLLTAGVLITACNKNNNNDGDNTPASGLMAFNLAPDVANASITLSSNLLTQTPLAYNSFTGTYLGVYSGTRPISAINANTGAEIASSSYDFVADKYYSLFVLGKNGSYRTVVVNDNADSLSTSSGEAFVRYINAIPDSSHPAVTFAVNGSNVVNDNAAFASVSEFKPIASGSVIVTVNNGGTINKSRTVTLDQRRVYTFLLTGVPGGTSADSLQIRYIQNGTVDETAARVSSVSAGRSVN